MNTENEQVIEQEEGVSKFWLFPALVLIVGISLYFKNLSKQGHIIQVTFESAEGMEAGKTKVRLRNVPIGTVKRIILNPDLKSVTTEIEIQKDMEKILSDDTKFWVVKPRIDSQGISGVGTILSGFYIGVYPGKSKNIIKKFAGLSKPPVFTINEEGLHLILLSYGEKQLKVGNPVYYRGMKVGSIEFFEYDISTESASYGIHIRRPFDKLVDTNTSFWNIGGFNFKTSTDGIKLEVNSLETLISGGIQFGKFENTTKGKPVSNGFIFTLFESKTDVLENREYEGKEFIVLADRSIGGLHKGAPVDYRGVKIGRVVNPHLSFDEITEIQNKYKLSDRGKIPILIRIEPARFSKLAAKNIDAFFEAEFKNWILRGMKASLSLNNLLAGSLKISLDLKKNKKIKKINMFGKYPTIPYEDSGVGELTENFNRLLTKVNNLPLKDLLVESVNFLKGLAPGSALYGNLESSSQKLEETLDSVKPILNDLDDNPNAFIFGKKNKKDIQPKAKVK